ncbi:ABC transporter substrate-binding protein [Streptomyces sp. JNUCC 63]
MYPAQSYRLPVLLAQEKGLFKKHGLKLDITEQPANLQDMQGLSATKKSDVGIIIVGTLGQGWQAGSEGRFFCGGIKVPQTTLVTPVGSKLPSIEDGADWKTVLNPARRTTGQPGSVPGARGRSTARAPARPIARRRTRATVDRRGSGTAAPHPSGRSGRDGSQQLAKDLVIELRRLDEPLAAIAEQLRHAVDASRSTLMDTPGISPVRPADCWPAPDDPAGSSPRRPTRTACTDRDRPCG